MQIGAQNVQKKRVRSVLHVPTELPFCTPPLLVGHPSPCLLNKLSPRAGTFQAKNTLNETTIIKPFVPLLLSSKSSRQREGQGGRRKKTHNNSERRKGKREEERREKGAFVTLSSSSPSVLRERQREKDD